MHYLLDGYNLLFFYLTPDENLKNKREELIHLLDEKLKLLKVKATLVFDGFSNMEEKTQHRYFDSLDVVFTFRNQTADEYILEQLSISKNINEETVVTADKNLAQSARNLGAFTKSPRSFIKWIANKQTKKEFSSIDEQNAFEDSKENIERLLKLFEKKLQESDFEL